MYQLVHYSQYDYNLLKSIKFNKYKGGKKKGIYNNAVIMLDTETSKSVPNTYNEKGEVVPVVNYVVAFSISIRYKGTNYCTLYGNKPSECIDCITRIRNAVVGDLFIYIHNLPYDWQFLRKFFIAAFDEPKKQLCLKSHKPIVFEFNNGIILKDSYVLSGRTLEKWAIDLDVEHKKAVGSWDYDLIRQQNHAFTPEELTYIERDTLAGVECIEATMKMLHKNISSIPYTVTGIIRDEVKAVGERNSAHSKFLKSANSYQTQVKLEAAFHGGYTHGFRYQYNEVIENVTCFDFASSYPFIMLAYKLPSSKFVPLEGMYSIRDILKDSSNYAFIFKLVAFGVELKDSKVPMPYLQFSKTTHIINPIIDNGRLLACDYCEIYLTEYDLAIIYEQYNFKKHACVEVEYSHKRYLPRWYTDIIYRLYYDKCTLKGKDNILYMLQKGKLNSSYGNCVQKPCRVTIEENFKTGEYISKEGFDFEKEYNKYIKKRKTVLNYAWGVWITSIAAYNLFTLGKCVDYENGGMWLYSDTDSCYSNKWNMQKIEAYNERCEKLLKLNNYEPVVYEGKKFILGVAEKDHEYSEFKFLGAKRYCGRDKQTGELVITIAGVPKESGSLCLDNDINNFKKGFCFSGSKTGKLTHFYIYSDNIYIDSNGNEVADSIDLNACDYILDSEVFSFDKDIISRDENEMRAFR